MNFEFKVGDVVIFRPDQGRGDSKMRLVKAFVAGIFHAKVIGGDGPLLRVRTPELIRADRPSDAIKRAAIAERRKIKKAVLAARRRRVEVNREAFVDMVEIGIRLTADGLPDKRCKPKYTAKTSPVQIKVKPRGQL